MSRGELDQLLDLMGRDETPLGKRDYAFLRLRMSTGVPMRYLQKLRWEQIESDLSGCWVRWRPETPPARLEDEVWQAILDWLRASGRLEGMQADKYIFTPLVRPLRAREHDQPQDWAEGRCLTTRQFLANLQLYGRYAGIRQAEAEPDHPAKHGDQAKVRGGRGHSGNAADSWTAGRI